MKMANLLAYYNTATITAEKMSIVHAPDLPANRFLRNGGSIIPGPVGKSGPYLIDIVAYHVSH